MVNCWFSVNLVSHWYFYSQSSVQQGQKRGIQNAYTFNITVVDQIIHLFAWFSDFTWAGVIWYFNRTTKDQAFGNFFSLWRRPKCCSKSSVFYQPFSAPVLYKVSWACNYAVNMASKVPRLLIPQLATK